MISRHCLLFILSSIVIYDGCQAKLLTKADFSDACKEGIDLSFRGFNDSDINELLAKKLLDKYVSDMEPVQLRGGMPNGNCGQNSNGWCQYGVMDDLWILTKQVIWVIYKVPFFIFGNPISPYPNQMPYGGSYGGDSYSGSYGGSYGDSYSGGYEPSYGGSYGGGESYGNNYYGARYGTAGRQSATSFGQPQPAAPHRGPQRFGRRELVATCDRIEFPAVFDIRNLRDVGSFVRGLKLRSDIRIPQAIINGISNALRFGTKSSKKASASSKPSVDSSSASSTSVDDLSSTLTDDLSFTPEDDLPNTRDEKFPEMENPPIEVPEDLLTEQPTETNTEKPLSL